MSLRDASSGKILWESDKDLSISGTIHQGDPFNIFFDYF